MNNSALLIFARNPEEGKVKTRLASTIGAANAYSVYMQMLQHAVSITRYLPLHKFIFYSEQIETGDMWDANHYHKRVQVGENLGERMSNAFAAAFQLDVRSVVIIGTDIPDLSSAIIMQAFDCLNSQDVVIGPAADGGYYLLGMKQYNKALFTNIAWSTPRVFDDTISNCRSNNLTWSLLPVLHDIDEEKDLVHFENNL